MADVTGMHYGGAIGSTPVTDGLPNQSGDGGGGGGGVSASFQAQVKTLEGAAAQVAQSILQAGVEAEKVSRYLGTAAQHAATIAEFHQSVVRSMGDVKAQAKPALTGYISGAPTQGAPFGPEGFIRVPGSNVPVGGVGGYGAPTGGGLLAHPVHEQSAYKSIKDTEEQRTKTREQRHHNLEPPGASAGSNQDVSVLRVGRLEVGGGAPGGGASGSPGAPGGGPVTGSPPEEAKSPKERQESKTSGGLVLPPGVSAPERGAPPEAAQTSVQRDRAAEERARTFQQIGQVRNLSDIGQVAAHHASKLLSQWQPGTLREARPEDVAGKDTTNAARGANGKIYVNKSSGNIETNPSAVGQHEEMLKGLGVLQTGVGNVGSGQGIPGTVEGIAKKSPLAGEALLGVAGTATALREGGEFIQGQRARNAYWQRIEGGSNFAGFGERAHEAGFGLSNLGTLSPGESDRLYQGVSEVGLQGGQRQDALSFGVNAYKQFGMTIDQSVQLVQVAASHGQTAFSQLNDSLKSVTQSAKDAGVNTDQARQKFTSYYNAALGMGSGAPAQQATATTNYLSSLGRAGQGISLGGQQTAQAESAQAGYIGLTPSQLQAGLQGGLHGAQARSVANRFGIYGRAAEDLSPSEVNALKGQGQENVAFNRFFTPSANNIINQATKSGQQITPGTKQWDDLLQQLEQSDAGNNAWNGQSALSAAQIAGVNVKDPKQALDYILRTKLDDNGQFHQAQIATRQDQVNSAIRTHQSGGQIRADEQRAGFPGSGGTLQRIGQDLKGLFGAGGGPGGAGGLSPAQNQYKSSFLSKGTDVPVIDSLLKSKPNANVTVQTKDGPRTVSMADAIKYYPNQLETGAASIDGQQTAGGPQSVTGLAAIQPGQTTDKTNEAAKPGMGARKDGPKQSGPQGSGTLTISAKPPLDQFFNFVYNNSNNNTPNTNPAQPPAAQSGGG